MKRDLKSVIFDFDGVILDSLQDQFNWFKYISEVLDKPFDYVNIDSFKIDYKEPVYPDMYDFLNLEWDKNKDIIWDEYNQWKRTAKIEIFPEIVSVLDDLKSLSLELGIASTNTREAIEYQLRNYNMEDYFKTIVTKDDVPEFNGEPCLKPDPSCLLIALGNLNHSPEQSLYVGDQSSDIIATKLVKGYLGKRLEILAVGYGYSTPEKLLDLYPEYYVDNPRSIIDEIKKYFF